MALTRSFKETVRDRAQRDPEFRIGLLKEAVDAFLQNDVLEGKLILREYINATVELASLQEVEGVSLGVRREL